MPKLDQTYVYYDNRKMKTHFAQVSFTELETAYKSLTSGSAMRLYLYLLHKISGRTPYDRNNKPRLGYYLGIEQIENAIGISRASIYRGFGDLVKVGLLDKHTFITDKDNKNIICTLSIPLNPETKTAENETDDIHDRSQNCDREISQSASVKGNSLKKTDLNFEPINLQQTKSIINPLIPKGKNNNFDNSNLEKAFKNDQRKKEIYRIVHSLENHGYAFIDEVLQFSNIYSWLRKDTNLSRRKRDLYKAIEIHNERMEARSHVDLTSVSTEPEKGGNLVRATPEKTKKDETNLIDLLDGDYNSILHDNLISQDSFFWRLPKELQDKYLPIITKKIEDGKEAQQKKYEEQKKQQEEWDRQHPTTRSEIPNIDTTSKKYKQLEWDLIHKFNMNKDQK